jgi:hypothetical protein
LVNTQHTLQKENKLEHNLKTEKAISEARNTSLKKRKPQFATSSSRGQQDQSHKINSKSSPKKHKTEQHQTGIETTYNKKATAKKTTSCILKLNQQMCAGSNKTLSYD